MVAYRRFPDGVGGRRAVESRDENASAPEPFTRDWRLLDAPGCPHPHLGLVTEKPISLTRSASVSFSPHSHVKELRPCEYQSSWHQFKSAKAWGCPFAPC
jgi:hypothetical protein